MYLDREAVLVPNLDGGVLERNNVIVIDDEMSRLVYLERDKEAKLAARFWELFPNVFHLEEETIMTMIQVR